jgi:glycosyltransferase involved in cell wall biosynthesis
LRIAVEEIAGGRFDFQVRSLLHLLRRASRFDVILVQEVLRGALNANFAGALLRVPVVSYMGISPLEYFRCKRERKQIGAITALVGRAAIRAMLEVNGRMTTRCLAMGPYLRDIAARYCPRSEIGLYYGVDTAVFRPALPRERTELRQRLGLPAGKFIIFFSSRMSHEKDPETVLEAVSRARTDGLDAVVLNLGGGYAEFLALAKEMQFEGWDKWVIGRPAVHPMTEVFDYFRAADAVVQASLAEGAGISPLEALASGTPVIATAVGGMAVLLEGYARLVPRRDAKAMAQEIIRVARNPAEARAAAMRGREYVVREWSREKAFGDLNRILNEVSTRSA